MGAQVKGERTYLKSVYKANMKKFIKEKNWKNGARWHEDKIPGLSPVRNYGVRPVLFLFCDPDL